MRRRSSNPTRRLRLAVERLPRHTKEAMIRGIDSNRIIVGAYVDPRSGGICPMLAAHRNGGRTDVASFARAWDEYTAAKRPRRANRREVRTLRALLTESLDLDTTLERTSISELAAQIRAEREAFRCAAAAPAAPAESPGEQPPVAQPAPALVPDEPDDAPIRVRRSPLAERRRLADVRVRSGWSLRRAQRGELKDLLAAAEEHLGDEQVAGERPAELVGD